MGKHTKRTYSEKEKIVLEILSGRSYSSVSRKYNIRSGTIANWKRIYLEGNLNKDNRGRRSEEAEDVEILKKSYALLMKIRSKRIK